MMVPTRHLVLWSFLVPGLLRKILTAWRKQAQALKEWIFRRLSAYRTNLSLEKSLIHKKGSEHASSPPGHNSAKDHGRQSTTTKGNLIEGKFGKETSDEDFQYHPVVDGERIPLNDILPALYLPYALPGGSIRDPSASTRSLASSLEAHSRAVAASVGRTPGHSVMGSSLGTRSSSSMNISVIAPESPPPIPDHSNPLYPTNLSFNPDQSRPPSLRENQKGKGVSDVTDSSADVVVSPISSIELETRPSSSSSKDDKISYPVDDSGVRISTRFSQGIGWVPTSYLEPIPPLFPTPSRISNINSYSWPPKLGHSDIVPIAPESMQRYSQRPQIALDTKALPPIPPLTTKFGDLNCNGWEICIHPEGARYFYNREKRVFVESHVFNFDGHVKQAMYIIEGFGHEHGIWEVMPGKDTELVLWLRTPTLSNQNAEASVCYYFVHHASRSIFFLDDYDPRHLPAYNELRYGPTSQSHLGIEIEAQYWFHCQLFPHSLNMTKDMVNELRGIILHFIGDTTTCPKGSTAPFALDELYRILSLMNDMEKYIEPSLNAGAMGANSCFSRLMFLFCRSRFLHYHAEPHARLERTSPVYGEDPHQRKFLIKTLSWILFFAPDFHLRSLQNMWVDGITHKSVFQQAVERMNGQWGQMNLMATVFLAVDVSFWSIQSNNINPGANRSPAQIFSYLSVCACTGSILLGMLLLLQNQTKIGETAEDFEKYMSSRHHPYLGLETLAILHSLPFSLLMWGIIFFSFAVASLCFIDSSVTTRTIIGIAIAVCAILVLWCIRSHWDNGGKGEEPNPPLPQRGNDATSDYQAHQGGHTLGDYEMGPLPNPPMCPNNHPNYSRRSDNNGGGTWSTSNIRSLRSWLFSIQRRNLHPA